MNTDNTTFFSRVMRVIFLLLLSASTFSFAQDAIQGTWATQADSYRGKNGQRFTFLFPGNGTVSSRVWGTDLYTDDCSIASAAVHAGLINPQNGGVVTIEIRPGAASYQGSTRNGVVSQGYGGFAGSFVFVNTGSTTVIPIPPSNAIQGTWATQADSYRGKNGQRFTFVFPGNGTVSSRVWGTDLYTDDCSIASAAVHAGLINPQNGGVVTIEIRPGAASYQGSTRNGVVSQGYGGFAGSFVFVNTGSTTVIPTPPSNAIQATWATQADSYRGKNGQRFTFVFPGNGTVSSRVWGTDLYTDDCSIASAAVHAGLINPQNGGVVTIEIRPGATSYQGSTRNGVVSQGYGGFAGSFVFVNTGSTTVIPTPPSNAIQGTWATQADSYRGKNGQRFTFVFPGNGTVSSRVWGTDLYTDDCSIASAAVHAGLITPQNGGAVTIEIRPGAASYQGSTRNGVVSQGYGGFAGSFVFVNTGSTTVISTPPSNAIQGTWATQADSYRGKNGQRFTFVFPGSGTVSSRVWGTDLYTDDCSIASAAVHAGLINPQNGGVVTIEIRPGAASYQGSTRNGVVSQGYGGFAGSFVFVNTGSTTVISTPPSGAIQGTWTTQADSYRGKNGQRFTFVFPGNGTVSSRVWGTDLYTDDCSIASAAVHAGLITPQNGGAVTIEIRPGAASYQGTTRNGVVSQGYGSWTGSFVFIK